MKIDLKDMLSDKRAESHGVLSMQLSLKCCSTSVPKNGTYAKPKPWSDDDNVSWSERINAAPSPVSMTNDSA